MKVLPVSWYGELARTITKVEEIGVWPEGLLDAYNAMIPKAVGDATPLDQRPLSSSCGVSHVGLSKNGAA